MEFRTVKHSKALPSKTEGCPSTDCSFLAFSHFRAPALQLLSLSPRAEPSQRSGFTLWFTSNNWRLAFRSLRTTPNKKRTNQLPPSALENERGKNQPTGKGWAWSDDCESSNLCCNIRLLTPRRGPAPSEMTFPRPQGLLAPPCPVIYFRVTLLKAFLQLQQKFKIHYPD